MAKMLWNCVENIFVYLLESWAKGAPDHSGTDGHERTQGGGDC
jgi:hypothetical protein